VAASDADEPPLPSEGEATALLLEDQHLAVNLNGRLTAEELHQNSHALFAWHGSLNDRLQALEGASNHLNLVAGLESWNHQVNLLAELGAQGLDHRLRDGGPAVTKMDHPLNPARVLDQAQAGPQVEAGKEVIRKERLRHPYLALARGALEPDAGQKDLHARLFAQVRRRDVFVLGVRAQAEPSQRSGFLATRGRASGWEGSRQVARDR
jgi:hypothetical protein